MQVTIDSSDPLEKALRVVGSLYGVDLTVTETAAPAAAASEPAPRAIRRPAKKTAKKTAKKAAKKATKAASATSRPRRARRTTRSTEDLIAIRAWARNNGFAVSDRGRVSNEVLAAYQVANPTG